MTPADLEFISYALSPFEGEPVSLSVYDVLCRECGLVIEVDVSGECPQCYEPTKEGTDERA